MKKALLFLALSFSIAGCHTVHKQTFNSAANASLKQITLIRPPNVDEVSVNVLKHAGESFGLVGGLVAVADMQTKTKKYNQVAGLYDWDGYVHQQLALALSDAGYEVKSLNLRTNKQQSPKYLKNYPEIQTDAVMDYYFSVGQVAAGSTTNYVPTVMLNARLVSTHKKVVLYEQQFNAGLPMGKEFSYIPIQHEYHNIHELLSHAEESKQALKNGIQDLTQSLANDLKKN